MTVSLQLLGSPRVSYGGRWQDVPLTKPSTLLFYLAFYGDWMSREELAFFFRPDADEATGRHYVRKLLNGAKALSWAQGLEIEPERLRWRADTDVARFRAAVDEGRWARALELYRGPFLSGMSAGGTPGFEAWLELEREDLDLAWQGAALEQAADLERRGDHRQAADLGRRLLRANSLAEEALQIYMRSVSLSGGREQALQAFERFREELAAELGVEPLEATCELAERLRRSTPSRGAESGRRALAPAMPERPAPACAERGADEDVQEDYPEVEGLLALLAEPDARLLTLIESGHGAGNALIIAKRVPDIGVALAAVASLAARLVQQGHHRRALELGLLVLGHPGCDEGVERRLELLWPLLEPHFPRLSAEARRRWRAGEGRDALPGELLDLVSEG